MLLLIGCGAVEPSIDGGSDSGHPVDGGVDAGLDGGPERDGGSSVDGGFCSPCVDRSDCGGLPNLCIGATGHCGLDCGGGKACPSGSVCQAISQGKGPAIYQCAPSVAACGVLSEAPPPDCPDGWTSYADGFFGTYCRGCHTAGFDTSADVHAGAEGVRLAIDLGAMPRGVSLTPAERRRILTWLACGSAAPPGHH